MKLVTQQDGHIERGEKTGVKYSFKIKQCGIYCNICPFEALTSKAESYKSINLTAVI